VATKLFAYSKDVAFHLDIFPSRVWARGSAPPLAAASSLIEEETFKFRRKIQNDKPVWALDIEIWKLFVFWCLYFGIWHYCMRAGQPRNLKPKPILPMVIVMYPGLKYRAAVDNG
jgi:hypothetical protein